MVAQNLRVIDCCQGALCHRSQGLPVLQLELLANALSVAVCGVAEGLDEGVFVRLAGRPRSICLLLQLHWYVLA